MLCCCVASEEGEKVPEIPEIQQRSVLDTAEAKLVEKAIETAPAEIQIKVEKDAPPAPAFGSFSVVVPVKGFSSLGLELDHACELGPMIKEVSKTGAVHVFNELHPGTALKLFDVITSINGVKSNDASEMMADEKVEGDVALTVLRPRKVELSLSKTTSLGLKLNFGSASFGAVVGEVGKGLVSTWNTTHSGDAVGENDRIIEVNGTQHLGEDLLAAIQGIQKDSKFSLTVLKY